jgi:general secretion pathway protein N
MPIKPFRWLLILFMSTFVWALWLLPARPLLTPLNGMMLASSVLQLSRIEGRLWQGSARWQWQGMAGGLRWDSGWRGTTFGADLFLSGDIVATGWAGGGPGVIDLRDLEAVVPVAPFVRAMPNVSADGMVSLRGVGLRLGRAGPEQARGALAYSGGRVDWSASQGAELPALSGALRQDGGAAVVEAFAPDGLLLADARLENEMAALRVYRAWPALLGVSQGGNPADIVFETSQQLAP